VACPLLQIRSRGKVEEGQGIKNKNCKKARGSGRRVFLPVSRGAMKNPRAHPDERCKGSMGESWRSQTHGRGGTEGGGVARGGRRWG